MIILGSIITLSIFLFVGWAVSTEMFQQRTWRKRVESGDVDIVGAIIEEALGAWRRGRPPRGTPSSLWAGVQGAQLVAITQDTATVSASAEGEFRNEGGQRVQITSALDEAIALATKLLDMMLYDVPNLRLAEVRVDIYSTFTGDGGTPVQRPILTSTADRSIADSLTWEALTPDELLGRFQTQFDRLPSGQGAPIVLPPIEGAPPRAQPQPDIQLDEARGIE
ncbi:hypothetical protein AYO38_06920 [bacterium SCGC AG-212-C10]|nr:hypothetical protein AYO38_06920 [bacterium SCGC AG-212-C10]